MKGLNMKVFSAPILLASCVFANISVPAETLLVGSGSDNAADGVEIRSGSFTGTFAPASGATYQIAGPRGLIVLSNTLYLVNQNANTPYSGEILKFDGTTGAFLGKLVAKENPNAPYAPRGIIAGPDNTIYVADLGNFDGINLGHVKRYSLAGAFLGDADTTGLTDQFFPMGLVIGPDNLLYVTGVGNLPVQEANGYIFRFQYHADTHDYHYQDTLVASTPANYYASGLHSPEGLTFGPDSRLYVTSFYDQYSDPHGNLLTDPDAVLIFDSAGQRQGQIYYYAPYAPRVYAQALVFGPRGDLFVPTTSGAGLRRYSAASEYQQFTPVPTDGSAPQQPWYAVFRDTDPHTLAYKNPSLTKTLAGSLLDLSWPASQVGWQLEAQTNGIAVGLRSNWEDVPGTLSTNHSTVQVDGAYGAVFFRLAPP